MVLSYWAITDLINGITSTILGLLVYLRNRNSASNVTYGLVCLCVATWSYSYFFWQISTTIPHAIFWGHMLMAGAILIPIIYLHHLLILLNLHIAKKKLLITGYCVIAFFSVLNFTPLFMKGVAPKLCFPYWPVAGKAFIPFLIIWGWYALYAIYILIKYLLRAQGESKNQLRYLLIATLLGYGGGASNYFLWLDIPILPVGNVLISFYIAIVAYAIVKYRLMDIKVVFTRAGIFLIIYSFVLGVPFLILAKEGSGWVATTTAVFLASGGPVIYRFLQRRADALLLNKQRRYQRILLQAASGMVTQRDLSRLSKLIVYILKRTIWIEFAVMFIQDKKNKTYRLQAIRNVGHQRLHSAQLSEDDLLVQYIKQHPEPFFFEEMPMHIREAFLLPLPTKVIISSFAGDDLLAFVLLGEKVNQQAYTEDDMNVFGILTKQAALAIENCIFFEESRIAQERMFSAEKLASIGGMADGVAHQIKNRLNQFSLASGELKFEIEEFMRKHGDLLNSDKDLKETFEYITKIADSQLENVKKTDGIIRGILDFARVEQKETFFSHFQVQEILDLAISLMQVKHEVAQVPLTSTIDGDGLVYGIKAQITEVIYNLLDNAYEAAKEKQMLLHQEGKEGFVPQLQFLMCKVPGKTVITISDNGIGVKDEDRRKIFAPFFTTKSSYKSGSGIGVYVVKRIIEENHHGKISFTSEYRTGTAFSMELPEKQG